MGRRDIYDVCRAIELLSTIIILHVFLHCHFVDTYEYESIGNIRILLAFSFSNAVLFPQYIFPVVIKYLNESRSFMAAIFFIKCLYTLCLLFISLFYCLSD